MPGRIWEHRDAGHPKDRDHQGIPGCLGEGRPAILPYNALYERYRELAEKEEHVIFGGRLGMYRYYDMHQVIAEALKCVKENLYG